MDTEIYHREWQSLDAVRHPQSVFAGGGGGGACVNRDFRSSRLFVTLGIESARGRDERREGGGEGVCGLVQHAGA